MKLKTKNSAAIQLMVTEVIAKKGLKRFYPENTSYPWIYYCPGVQGEVSVSDYPPFYKDCETVSPADFLKFLESLPDDPKFVDLKIGDLDVRVSADKVVAGCQEYSLKEVTAIKRAVDKFLLGIFIDLPNKKTIKVDTSGIYCDGRTLSFANYAKIIKVQEGLK